MMLRMALAMTVLFFTALTGIAQVQPAAEIFTGYSLSHQSDHAHLSGWNAQFAGNLTDSFSLVADASGHYLGNDPRAIGVYNLTQTRISSYSFGPRAYNRLERVNLFTHAMVGITHVTGHGVVPADPLSTQKLKFNPVTLTMGGGIDYKLSDQIALRLAQIDYRLFRIEGTNSNGGRFSAGIVFFLRK